MFVEILGTILKTVIAVTIGIIWTCVIMRLVMKISVRMLAKRIEYHERINGNIVDVS